MSLDPAQRVSSRARSTRPTLRPPLPLCTLLSSDSAPASVRSEFGSAVRGRRATHPLFCSPRGGRHRPYFCATPPTRLRLSACLMASMLGRDDALPTCRATDDRAAVADRHPPTRAPTLLLPVRGTGGQRPTDGHPAFAVHPCFPPCALRPAEQHGSNARERASPAPPTLHPVPLLLFSCPFQLLFETLYRQHPRRCCFELHRISN